MSHRWWIYQRERFPLLAHGTLIAAFSFSAVSFSALLRSETLLPSARSVFVAFVTLFIFFFQLRIADEFKDREEDTRHRPYRPVPRGLVKLSELKAIGIAGAVLQLGLAAWLHPYLLPLLAIVWIYLGLMSKEFFVRDWLKQHPFTYMWTHMIILPLISLYATACDWIVASSGPPDGVAWFLVLSFCNGFVFEIGRKIRAPEDEEHGVETYSSLWGPRNAVLIWLGSLLGAAIAFLPAAQKTATATFVWAPVWIFLGAAAIIAWLFLREPAGRYAKLFQPMSGFWSLLLYLALGAFPRFFPI